MIIVSNVLKRHQILHPMVEFEARVGMEIDKDFNLDVFEMSIGINEPTMSW
jgi:hypothetical protein